MKCLKFKSIQTYFGWWSNCCCTSSILDWLKSLRLCYSHLLTHLDMLLCLERVGVLGTIYLLRLLELIGSKIVRLPHICGRACSGWRVSYWAEKAAKTCLVWGALRGQGVIHLKTLLFVGGGPVELLLQNLIFLLCFLEKALWIGWTHISSLLTTIACRT